MRFDPKVRRYVRAPVLALFFFAACGPSRGSKCDSDSDCSSGEACSAVACTSSSSQKECVVPCSTDDDCRAKDGPDSKCYGLADCQKYCSSG